MSERGCARCGGPVTGRRQFCVDVQCMRARERERKRRQRAGGVAQVVPLRERRPGDVGSDEIGVLEVTRQALDRAGRLDTPAGRAALVLASRLTVDAQDSGSSLAQVAKALSAMLDEALRDTVVESTPLLRLRDELEARRERRRQSSA